MTLRTLLLSPVLAVQAVWVTMRATRLPEPAGPREGMCGAGPPLRLLILGDRSAAGVGAAHQHQALAGQLTADLAQSYSVDWRLVAKSGVTVADTLAMLAALQREQFDIVVVALGVNDTKNGVSLANWISGYTRLLDMLQVEFKAGHIFLSGLPPVRHFPLLPWPLKAVLGARAEQFDAALHQIADSRDSATHLPINVTLDVSAMAPDGFHPGPSIYAEWATGVAAAIRSRAAAGSDVP